MTRTESEKQLTAIMIAGIQLIFIPFYVSPLSDSIEVDHVVVYLTLLTALYTACSLLPIGVMHRIHIGVWLYYINITAAIMNDISYDAHDIIHQAAAVAAYAMPESPQVKKTCGRWVCFL